MHKKVEQMVHRVPVYHSLPLFLKHLVLVWYVCYNYWASVNGPVFLWSNESGT
jgi:hypothetical protein